MSEASSASLVTRPRKPGSHHDTPRPSENGQGLRHLPTETEPVLLAFPSIPGDLPAPSYAVAEFEEPATRPLGGFYATIKHALDWLLAAVMLLLASPVILVVAVLVKLTSRGPAFYTQTRVGKNGTHFTIFKIRTMRHNAEVGTGAVWASQDDPRTTPIGKFLRASHLDELPQLLNVLRGDMSLIGPRPERPEIAQVLETKIARYADRHLVRPGISGLAQLQLPPDADLEGVRRKLACDLYYIENLGAWLDFRLLLGTGLPLLKISSDWCLRMLRIPNPLAAPTPYQLPARLPDLRSPDEA